MEKGLQSRCEEEEIVISSTGETISSREEKCNDKLKRMLRDVNNAHNLQTVLGCSWQGVIFKTIIEDESMMKGNFDWLCRWKSCPTSTVSEMMFYCYSKPLTQNATENTWIHQVLEMRWMTRFAGCASKVKNQKNTFSVTVAY